MFVDYNTVTYNFKVLGIDISKNFENNSVVIDCKNQSLSVKEIQEIINKLRF